MRDSSCSRLLISLKWPRDFLCLPSVVCPLYPTGKIWGIQQGLQANVRNFTARMLCTHLKVLKKTLHIIYHVGHPYNHPVKSGNIIIPILQIQGLRLNANSLLKASKWVYGWAEIAFVCLELGTSWLLATAIQVARLFIRQNGLSWRGGEGRGAGAGTGTGQRLQSETLWNMLQNNQSYCWPRTLTEIHLLP